MGRDTRSTWAKRVEAWKTSRLTAKEFASKHALRAGTLAWWAWRLGKERSGGKSAQVAVRRDRTTIEPLTFVEMTSSLALEPLEIVLRNELRVRVGASFDEAALVSVLDVLERRR